MHGRLPDARALREDLQRAAAEIASRGRPPRGSRLRSRRGLPTARRKPIRAQAEIPARTVRTVASPVRTRFAPSPTGLLHVGGVRTALFSWLFARHNGGRFVLRIEDTDETREHPEAIEQIQRSLRWVGLDWDEGPGIGGPHGPYVQSERRARHHEVAEQFLADGLAYRCYCTPEELAAERDGRAERGPAVHLLAPLPRARATRSAPSARPPATRR